MTSIVELQTTEQLLRYGGKSDIISATYLNNNMIYSSRRVVVRGGGRVASAALVVVALLFSTSLILLICCNNFMMLANHYDDYQELSYDDNEIIEQQHHHLHIGQNHRRLGSMLDAIQAQQLPRQRQPLTDNNMNAASSSQQLMIYAPQPPEQQPVQQVVQHGKHNTVTGESVQINMMRRAKDVVSNTDVPFLLQIPHTSSETIYDIMTQCYGLVGRQYNTPQELVKAKAMNVVDNHYVSSHDRPIHMFKNFGNRFHFIATPHYQEGTSLLTLKHKGRIIVMMRHPCQIAEEIYLTRPNVQGRGKHVQGLIRWVNSTKYYDNWMTRMLANVPPDVVVTEDHFKEARMILENKFLIGMQQNMPETVQKRLGLYFGWHELPNKQGCEIEMIKKGMLNLSPSSLEEGSEEWRFVRNKNHFDMKLYVRSQHVFGDQKMRVPVHAVIRKEQEEVVNEAIGHLRNVKDERDSSDIPFFWHIPKASGTTVKEILSNCYDLVRTEMIKPPSSLEVIADKNVLNVDLSSPDAVAVARNMKVADRGLADVFVSQLGLEGSTVFSTYHMGRAFTIMRHPVKLAASLFYYRRIATWEPTYRPDYKDISLEDYVKTDGYYDNWMVRMLTNAKLGGLNDNHLALAKTIIKEKFIIGISDHMDETFRILEMYYGWAEKKEGCVNFHLHSAPSNKNKYTLPDHNGPVWNVIADKNKYDMALYYYALEIFGDQSENIFRAEKTVI